MPEFTDVQFMTAKEKARVLKQWTKFLASNMHEDQWAKDGKFLYNHLHLHCGHIAHFDQYGFYHAQFASARARVEFMQQFAQDHESGRLYWGAGEDYRDLGTAMYEVLLQHADRIVALAQNAHRSNLEEQQARIAAQLEAM